MNPLALQPGVAYRTTNLLLPKGVVNADVLRNQLTFSVRLPVPRVLVWEHPHHVEIPRATFSDEQLAAWGIPVQTLPCTQTPRISLRLKPGVHCRDAEQQRAWDALSVQPHGGTLVLGCGKGKTFLALRYAAQRGVPVLITSAQEAHLKNWRDELRARFDLDTEEGWVGDRLPCTEVCFGTVQKLSRRVQEGRIPHAFHTHYGLVVFDEVHHMSASYFGNALHAVRGDRLGLTATSMRTDGDEGIFLSHIGPVFYEDTEQPLKPVVRVTRTEVSFTPKEAAEVRDRQGAINLRLFAIALGKHAARNQMILDLLRKDRREGRVCYVLTHSVDHAMLLASLWPEPCGLIHGGVEDRLGQLHTGQVVFATMDTATEALNRTDLDTLYLTTPFAAHARDGKVVAIALVQSVGRILRPLPGKDPLVRIFQDTEEPSEGLVYSLVRACKRLGYRVTR